MILDNTLVLSDSQAITADAGSTNVIDLGAPGTPIGAAAALIADVGKATGIDIICNVVEAFNNLTTLAISLQSDDNAAFSSPTEIATRTFALAEINATKMLRWPSLLPEGTSERYVRLYYDVTGTAPTTGKITAAIVAARQTSMVR
jgi:hypothetical protein